jgi:uncharacterized tellurite resistance protein B-like protein
MLADLSKQDRLRLLRFVCSFAWTDLEVSAEERRYAMKLASRLRLSPKEKRQVEQWLERPPAPEEVDPFDVPHEHRALFVKALQQVAETDGAVTPEERMTLVLFKRLTA